jgi:murein DD-endopeptidase MepM/ murein hydrolase activator NlpD
VVITSRVVCRLSILAVLVVATGACTSVAQVSNLTESTCAAEFEKQLSSILVQESEKPEVADALASQGRLALASRNRGPRPFLIFSSSGADYTFFVQAKKAGCLLRLYGRRRGSGLTRTTSRTLQPGRFRLACALSRRFTRTASVGDPCAGEALVLGELPGVLSSRLKLVEKKLFLQADQLALTPTIVPAAGVLTAGFGARPDPFTNHSEFYTGIDISTPAGNRVVAPASGTVVRVGWDQGYGRFLEIAHG